MVKKAVLLGVACLIAVVSHAGLDDEKHMTVAMRMIGHQLLLQDGDYNSRVLPIRRMVNEYHIRFETELAIIPDTLLAITKRVAKQADLPDQYILQVLTCDSSKVVYAYEVGNTESTTIIPCKSRALPKACYSIVFTDLSVTKKAQVAKSDSSTWLGYLFSGLAVVLAIIAIVWYRRDQKNAAANQHLIAIGKYHFDKLNSELIIAEQRIELTGKEADLLLLLFETANKTVEREVLLNKVWGDEGDYIGRTLDVFISKLRKKLEFDTTIKIVNVRGVGYKLVLAG
jgi:hypothetical protein